MLLQLLVHDPTLNYVSFVGANGKNVLFKPPSVLVHSSQYPDSFDLSFLNLQYFPTEVCRPCDDGFDCSSLVLSQRDNYCRNERNL